MPAVPSQIRYVTQWFQEWGEMQRNDFLPVLIQKFHDKATINGLVSDLDKCNVENRPPSIFQCRIKLFKEWSDGWSQSDREQILIEFRSIDQDFMDKFDKQMNGVVESNETHLTNGNADTVMGEC